MTLRFPFICALALPSFALGCSATTSPAAHDAGHDVQTTFDGAIPDGVDDAPADASFDVDDTPPAPDGTTDGMASETLGDGATTTCAKDHHPGDVCNMIAQNCADPQTCDWDPASGHTICFTRPVGPATKGEACNATTPCDRGLFCFSNRCSPACCAGDNSICGGDGTCTLAITSSTPDGGTNDVVYHACTYNAVCHAFQYDCPAGQVCLFNGPPAVFSCALPAATPKGVDVAPGVACSFSNDCGESQLCTSLTSSGSDGGASASTCFLVCNLSGKATPGDVAKLGGRFAADGTCTIGGKSYGTCTTINDGSGGDSIGGGLGLCVP